MRKIGIALVVLLLLGIGAWLVFGRGAGSLPGVPGGSGSTADADAPLAFAPADTPYLFANVERMPKATVDALLQQSEPMVNIWRGQFDLMRARLQADAADTPAAKWILALDAEFKDKSLSQSIAGIGLDMQSLSAIYGIGLVPVARMTLADPAAFRAFIARLEQHAGEKLATGTIDGIDYWQASAPEEPLRAILALHGDHLVMTLAPVGDDTALRTLLGIDRPAQSLIDGGALVAINRDYGFTPFATGYVDSARLLAQFTKPATPLETAFLAALKIEKPAIEATCQTEFAAIAAIAPRLVFGYSKLEAKASEAESRIELRKDIAQDLMALRAPMPGLDAANDSAFNLGVAFFVGEVPTIVNKWADAVAAAPFQCARLASLNASFADLRQQAANPAVFMVAPAVSAFHAILDRVDIKSLDTEPDLAGKLLIASPNPAALIGMAKGFAPPIASLDLKPDGKVHPLPAMPGMPPNLSAHAAMTDGLLGLSFGAGEEATLLDAMRTDAARQPLLVIGYSGEAFTQFADQMAATNAAIEDPASRAEAERSMEMMRAMYALIGRSDMSLEFDERGIVFRQSATLK
jgi:hypothetical protein